MARRRDRTRRRGQVRRIQQARGPRGVVDDVARDRVRVPSSVCLGGRGPGEPDSDLAFPPRAQGRRHRAVAVDAAGPRALGGVVCDRSNARQGAEDRVRADARVRAEHGLDAGAPQEVGGRLMRTATTVEASGFPNWPKQRDFIIEAEKIGLDICWVAEAWGSDAPSALGYYAACTDRMLLGSGVIQGGARTPVAVAQAAMTLSNLSGGRFLLGLGASGPQIIEGLHGGSFQRPGVRLREIVEIVRRAFDGDKISYSGSEFRMPHPGGDAVPMRLSIRADYKIPIYLATLSPAMLRLTGEVADGWLAASLRSEEHTSELQSLRH